MAVRIKKDDVVYVVRICSVLLVITMFIALLLSFVNAVTKDVIDENDARKLSEALGELFPSVETPLGVEVDIDELPENVDAFYEVRDGETSVGYYAKVSPNGFKDAVEMLVGLDTSGKVIGVSIVSCSETVGIGTKIEDESFLSRFCGVSGSLTYKKGASEADVGYIDGISGATYSSKAVIAGVDAALGAYAKATAK